jgi:hypothetical protein
MHLGVFEPTIPAEVRTQAHTLDRMVTGIVRVRYDAASSAERGT